MATATKSAYTRKLISSKVEEIKPENIVTISKSGDSFNVAWSLWDLESIEITEHFNALFLNRGNKVVGWAAISQGGCAGTVVDMKILFSHALLCNAAAIIVFHNHPSGLVAPSIADTDITKKIVSAGKVLDIAVLDHLILAPSGDYYSFADNGMM
jgi:DNA repair protein RadC